ncbi:hypothetical protein HY626_03755 [Candidatus Uhrbacteria bacterium]|nr:hypothetical protein [Candidatus Uhrbacteria bacterium]
MLQFLYGNAFMKTGTTYLSLGIIPLFGMMLVTASFASETSFMSYDESAKRTQTLSISGEIELPAANGTGLVVTDLPVTMHAQQGALTITRWKKNGKFSTILGTRSTPGTLASFEMNVLAVWIHSPTRTLYTAWSHNGGKTFSSTKALDSLENSHARPTACVNKRGEAWVVWTDTPANQTSGKLRMAMWNGESWSENTIVDKFNAVVGSLSCGEEHAYLAWSDEPTGVTSSTTIASMNKDGTMKRVKTFLDAYQPTISTCEDTVWIGYRNTKNETWVKNLQGEKKEFERGEFFSSTCQENIFAFPLQTDSTFSVKMLESSSTYTLDPVQGSETAHPASTAFGQDQTFYVSWASTRGLKLVSYQKHSEEVDTSQPEDETEDETEEEGVEDETEEEIIENETDPSPDEETPTDEETPDTTNGGGGGSSGGGSSGGGSSGGGSTNEPSSEQEEEESDEDLPVAHSLIKLEDDGDPQTQYDSAVYYVGADQNRHAFPNASVYHTWYCDFSEVEIVTFELMSSLSLGENVTFRPGSLVKFQSTNHVYAVDLHGVLRWILTEELAQQLYGKTWAQQIYDISDTFFSNYSFGVDLDESSDFDVANITASVRYPSDSMDIPGYETSSGSGLECDS